MDVCVCKRERLCVCVREREMTRKLESDQESILHPPSSTFLRCSFSAVSSFSPFPSFASSLVIACLLAYLSEFSSVYSSITVVTDTKAIEFTLDELSVVHGPVGKGHLSHSVGSSPPELAFVLGTVRPCEGATSLSPVFDKVTLVDPPVLPTELSLAVPFVAVIGSVVHGLFLSEKGLAFTLPHPIPPFTHVLATVFVVPHDALTLRLLVFVHLASVPDLFAVVCHEETLDLAQDEFTTTCGRWRWLGLFDVVECLCVYHLGLTDDALLLLLLLCVGRRRGVVAAVVVDSGGNTAIGVSDVVVDIAVGLSLMMLVVWVHVVHVMVGMVILLLHNGGGLSRLVGIPDRDGHHCRSLGVGRLWLNGLEECPGLDRYGVLLYDLPAVDRHF